MVHSGRAWVIDDDTIYRSPLLEDGLARRAPLA